MERPPYTDNAPLSITYAFNSSSNHISQFNGTAITSSSIDDNPSPTLRGTREEELLAKVPFVIENEMIKLLQKNPNNNDTTTTSKSNPLRNKIRYDGENSEAMETTIAMEPIYENVPLKSETKEYVNMPISASTNDFPHGSYYYYTADSNTNNSAQTQEKPRRTRKSKNQQQQQVDVQRNGIDNALTFTQEQLQQYIAQQSPSSSDFDTQSQQYVTQLLQQNGYILQPMSSDVWTALFNQSNPTQQQQQNGDANNETGTSSVPTTISRARSNRNQPIYFANRLTNPVFSVDKELLTNTIANQFGYDIDSPQLQKLVQNQHLFAARRRTFANMVWQLTPDEEVALLSSSSTNHSPSNDLDTTTNETNNINSNQEHGLISNGKSILKKEVVKNKPLIISSTNTTAYNKRKNVSFTNATFYVS
ncbi:unnamed protein product [Didymodactylos carnosus]|uniref:Uncharacterized protein n=1 Tax=Didymodactylos carnosus TaxID=1234261 RepID=A0A814NRW6_9BILA|nr:unnamed protein product [Didymodactylos carnosus]CAF3862243.1 unnamed protein product [Didymodactylos carnosus]